jgi:hypothetical protein
MTDETSGPVSGLSRHRIDALDAIAHSMFGAARLS